MLGPCCQTGLLYSENDPLWLDLSTAECSLVVLLFVFLGEKKVIIKCSLCTTYRQNRSLLDMDCVLLARVKKKILTFIS